MDDGQYDKAWQSVHLLPEEVRQATLDLKARHLLPVHHSKFTLDKHAWDEPVIRTSELAVSQPYRVATPMSGEVVYLDNPGKGLSKDADATLRHLPHDPVDRRKDRGEELALSEDRIRRLRAYRDKARRGRVDRRTCLDGTVRGQVASAATQPEAADATTGFHRRREDAVVRHRHRSVWETHVAIECHR